MQVTAEQLQQLYIAYFNRPADALGLQSWQKALTEGATLESVAEAFSTSAEYAALYGDRPYDDLVNAAYVNLFGRPAEAGGTAFWTGALERGVITPANFVMQIMAGAQNDDAKAVACKATAATAFTAALGTPDQIAGYTGTAANAIASHWLATVTNDATLNAAEANLANTLAQTIAAGNADLQKGTLTVSGYLQGATVFVDANGNGKLDQGEASTVSDAQGHFALHAPQGQLVAVGGTDLATGLAYHGILRAGPGATTLSALSTLQQALMKLGQTEGQATAAIASVFLPASSVDLAHYDALGTVFAASASAADKATALQWQMTATKVESVVVNISHALSKILVDVDESRIADTVFASLAKTINSGQVDKWNFLSDVFANTVVNLDDPRLVNFPHTSSWDPSSMNPEQIAAAEAADRLSSILKYVDEAINTPSDGDQYLALARLAQAAVFTQGKLADDLKADFLRYGSSGNPYKDLLPFYFTDAVIGQLDPSSNLDDAAIAESNTGHARAPVLLSATRAIGADDPIVLTFNEPVALGHENSEIMLTFANGWGYVTFRDEVTVSGNTVTIRPREGLQPNTDYVLHLGDDLGRFVIKDLEGNFLTHEYLVTISTSGGSTPIFTPGTGAHADTLYVSGHKSGEKMTIDLASQPGHFTSVDASAATTGVILWGNGSGTLTGSDFNDVLHAHGGNMILKGGKGPDQLYGGYGGNTIFQFATSDFDATTAEALFKHADNIGGWGTSNTIQFDGLYLTTHAHAATGDTISVTIGTDGVATITKDSEVRDEAVLEAVVAAVGNDPVGTAVIFDPNDFAEMNYLFVVGDDRPGIQAGDSLILLASGTTSFVDGKLVTPEPVIAAGTGSQTGTLLLSGVAVPRTYSDDQMLIDLDHVFGESGIDHGRYNLPAGGPFNSVDASALKGVGVAIYGRKDVAGTLTGTDLSDSLLPGDHGDYVLRGGKGADDLFSSTGGTTTYLFSTKDFVMSSLDKISSELLDEIRFFDQGKGIIRFDDLTLSVHAHEAPATEGIASIGSNGVATFVQRDMLDRETMLHAVLNAVGSDPVGTAVAFGNYLFVVGDSTPGLQAGDALIDIVGMKTTGLHIENGAIVDGFVDAWS